MRTRFALILVGALALAGFAAPDAAPLPDPAAVAISKPVYVSRHLQKREGSDPSLTGEGAANAQKLEVSVDRNEFAEIEQDVQATEVLEAIDEHRTKESE